MAKKGKSKKKLIAGILLGIDNKPARMRGLRPVLNQLGFELELITPKDKNFLEQISKKWSLILLAGELSSLVPKIRNKRGSRQVPILLIYFKRQKNFRKNLLKGADDYLEAPISVSELEKRLRILIERAKLNLDSRILKIGSQVLQKIIASLLGDKNDFEVLRSASLEIGNLFPRHSCSIIMLDRERNRAIVVADARSEAELDIELDLKNYPEIRNVVETGRVLAIQDVQRHALLREVRAILATKSIYSLLLIPVYYFKELIGVIIIRSLKDKYEYTRADIHFARLIGEALAIALKNIRLARMAEAEAREKVSALKEARTEGAVSKRLAKLFDYASDGLILINQKAEITGVNQNFLRLSGFEREELVDKKISEFLEFEKPQKQDLEEWVKKKRQSGSINLRLKVKSGEEKFASAHLEALPETNKEILISVHDVTEERKLGLELRRTKEFLENLIQNSLVAVISADMNGTIILFNRGAEELTGYKAEEAVGKKSIVELYAPGGARAVMKKLRSPFYGGVGRLETTHNVIIGKDGQEIPINMTAAIIYDEQGKEIASVGMYYDLRERIEIEKRLRQAQERLLESQKKEVMMALAGAAAHELNQPLTSILGYAQMLARVKEQLKKQLGEDDTALNSLQNGVEVIGEQAERMAQVIKELGELTEFRAKQYAGKQQIADLDWGKRLDRSLDRALGLLEEAILVMDSELVILNGFGRANNILGEEVKGKSLSRYFEGIQYTELVKLVERAKDQGYSKGELELRSAGGEKKKAALVIEKGEAQELTLVIQEVSRQRELEKELREFSAFREQLFVSLPVPLLIFDPDGKIAYLSKEAERLFGYSIEELKGKFPEALLVDYDAEVFLRLLRRLRQKGALERRLWAKNKQGKTFELYVFNSAMRDEKGEVIGFIAFIVSLYEKKLLEQAIEEKIAYLGVIKKNTELLVQSKDWREALASMLEGLRQVLEFDLSSIIFLEPTGRGLYHLSYDSITGKKEFRELRLFEFFEEVKNWLIQPGVIVFEDIAKVDFSGLPTDLKELAERLKQSKILNFISLPLKFQEEFLGRLFLAYHQSGQIPEESLNKAEPLIEQIAIALSHFRLYLRMENQRQELGQRNLFLGRILEQSQKIDLNQTEDKIISQFLDLFQEIFPRAHLWLAWQVANQGLLVKGVSNLDSALLGQEVKLKDEVRKSLISSGRPLHFEPEIEVKGFLNDAKSLILVPVISAEDLIGLIGVESHHKDPFSKEEEFLLQLFSQYLALLVPNLLRIRESTILSKLRGVLVENTSAFIVMFDKEGKIIICNRAVCEQLGIKQEEALGKNLLEFAQKYLIGLRDNAGNQVSLKDFLDKVGKMIRLPNYHVRFRAESGEEGEMLYSADVIYDERGNVSGLIAIGQDLKPLQKLEAKMIHLERLASVGQMASGIAHDLNNPLQAILTSNELVKRKLESLGEQETANRLQFAIDAGEKIRRLTQNLMSFVRPSRGVVGKVNLRELLEEIISFSGYELQRGGVEIENLISKDLPGLKMVKDQMEQLLINLLYNASQACAEKGGGKVKVKARVRGDWMELKVEDNGIGVPPENLPRLFEPFFTTKPEGKGTGLGLNIVQSIVERHQGKIQVKSKLNQGTIFTILFPLNSQ